MTIYYYLWLVLLLLLRHVEKLVNILGFVNYYEREKLSVFGHRLFHYLLTYAYFLTIASNSRNKNKIEVA